MSGAVAKANLVDLAELPTRNEDNELALTRELLNEAIDESGWKKEAIAAAIGVEPAYFSKMRSGEKPWALKHVVALPDDIENIFKRKYAETSPGAIVVTPVSLDQARRQLATGLISLLCPHPRMAKSGLLRREE